MNPVAKGERVPRAIRCVNATAQFSFSIRARALVPLKNSTAITVNTKDAMANVRSAIAWEDEYVRCPDLEEAGLGFHSLSIRRDA